MPDTPVATATPASTPLPIDTTAQTSQPVVFAGKFNSPQALEQGYREVRKTVADKHGIDPLADTVKLVGEGGMFKDHGALEEAYKKSSRLIGVKVDAEAPKPTGELKIDAPKVDGEAPPLTDDAPDVPALVLKAGLTIEALTEQFTKNGDLTPEQYDAIRKARPSLTRGDIKTIADGMAAKAVLAQQAQTQIRADAIKAVGGEQQLATLLNKETLKEFVNEEEMADFNRRLANPKLAIGAVNDLNARYNAHIGASGRGVIAGGLAAGQSHPKSAAEFSRLVDRAAAGDASAIAVINATPQSVIDSWRF